MFLIINSHRSWRNPHPVDQLEVIVTDKFGCSLLTSPYEGLDDVPLMRNYNILRQKSSS
ncbi:hypothetical protein N8T08_011137 [Aspergillus melleus]|uniref:Uncharacterized protein n=1 Tax=Aspergillus melleus TaxID=138277 RepID=A0ACC3AQA8_9EURO|nr:hypothetical protein N8T08_011137 [Aspergillus melleus]